MACKQGVAAQDTERATIMNSSSSKLAVFHDCGHLTAGDRAVIHSMKSADACGALVKTAYLE